MPEELMVFMVFRNTEQFQRLEAVWRNWPDDLLEATVVKQALTFLTKKA